MSSTFSANLGSVEQLEAADLVGSQPVRPPDALHRADAEPAGRGHRRRRPVGHLAGRRLVERARHHRLDHGLGQRRNACRPGLVVHQTVHAVRHEAFLPAPDAGLRHPGPAHHRGGAAAVCGRQDDPRPPDVLLRAVAVRHDRLEPSTIGGAHVDLDSLAHGHSLRIATAQRESFVRLDPLEQLGSAGAHLGVDRIHDGAAGRGYREARPCLPLRLSCSSNGVAKLLPESVTGTGDEWSLRAIAEDVGFAPMSGLVGEAAAGS